MFDGGYVEREGETLEFYNDRSPSSDDVVALEDEVMRRFSHWVEANGYLAEEPGEAAASDEWFGPAGLDIDPGPRPAGKRRLGAHVECRRAGAARRRV